MEPIISPWIIYLLGAIDKFNDVLITILIVCLSLMILVGSYFVVVEEESFEKVKIKTKKFFIVGIICLIISIFFPSKNTVIGMIVAQNITPVNIEKALKSGKDLKNELKKDVIDIIQSIQKKDEKK